MPRLSRPYIPLSVRVEVAEQQVLQKWNVENTARYGPQLPVTKWGEAKHNLSQHRWLESLLSELFQGVKFELHHRPALCNRPWDEKAQDYDPPANDPAYLVYVPKGEHDIETRIRGQGALRSDLGQKRYLKKVARNRDPKRPRRKWPTRKLQKAINTGWKRRWPSRRLGKPAGKRKGWAGGRRPPAP